MMQIKTLVVGQLQANCYLVWDKKTKQAVIIDPGDAADLIINKIKDHDLVPKIILATHGHFDHILAATELKLAFGIPFGAHQADLNLVKKMSELARYWLGNNINPGPPPDVDQFLRSDMVIKFGDEKLKVIETPGHSPGGVVFYRKHLSDDHTSDGDRVKRSETSDSSEVEFKNVLFSGDTLFKQGVGRTDLPYSSESELKKSIKNIFKLPGNTIVYPGHGSSTTIGEEIPQLKWLLN